MTYLLSMSEISEGEKEKNIRICSKSVWIHTSAKCILRIKHGENQIQEVDPGEILIQIPDWEVEYENNKRNI